MPDNGRELATDLANRCNISASVQDQMEESDDAEASKAWQYFSGGVLSADIIGDNANLSDPGGIADNLKYEELKARWIKEGNEIRKESSYDATRRTMLCSIKESAEFCGGIEEIPKEEWPEAETSNGDLVKMVKIHPDPKKRTDVELTKEEFDQMSIHDRELYLQARRNISQGQGDKLKARIIVEGPKTNRECESGKMIWSDSVCAERALRGEQRIQAGAAVMLNGFMVDWKTAMNPRTAESLGEAEIMSICESNWIEEEMENELGERIPNVISAPATGAFDEDPGGKNRLNYHASRGEWIREIQGRGEIEVIKVRGVENESDVITRVPWAYGFWSENDGVLLQLKGMDHRVDKHIRGHGDAQNRAGGR